MKMITSYCRLAGLVDEFLDPFGEDLHSSDSLQRRMDLVVHFHAAINKGHPLLGLPSTGEHQFEVIGGSGVATYRRGYFCMNPLGDSRSNYLM